MGQQYFKRPVYAPDFNPDVIFNASTNGVKGLRVVRLHTNGTVRVTTGASGRQGIGISRTSASSGQPAVIRCFGRATVCPSTAALAVGAWVRGSSGPSTGSTAGTVKALATPTSASNATDGSAVGFTLSSAAAGAVSASRTVTVFICHPGRLLA